MRALLLPRPAFVAAVVQRIEWLGEHGTGEQLDNFLLGLRWVRERIAEHPQAGPLLRQDKSHVLRLRLFARPLPYFVYYAHSAVPPIAEVYLVRLFASGQRSPKLKMSQWPW